MNRPTPRTDTQICTCTDGYAWVKPSFARQLENELDDWKEKYEIEMMCHEKCSQCGHSWSPSLVESGWCIFCIQKETKRERDEARKAFDDEVRKQFKLVELNERTCDERDQLRKVADELVASAFVDKLCTCAVCERFKRALAAYNQLPHRKESK